MAATLLDGQANISATLVAPTVSAGNNRKQIFILSHGNFSGDVTVSTSLAVGGVTATYEGGHALGSTLSKSSVTIFSLNEAQLAAQSGSAVVITGGSYSRRLLVTISIQDTAQTPSTSSGTYSSAGANTASGAVTALTRFASSYTLFAVHAIQQSTATMTNPSRVDFWNSLSTQVSIGHAVDTARTVDASFTISSCPCAAAAVNFAPFPTATINTINGSAFGAVKAGSTGNTVTTTSSFTPTSGTHGGKAISAIAGSAGSYTFTSAAYVDGATFPQPDTAQTFALTDGVSTPTASSVYSSPNGMSSVVIVNPETIDNTYLTEAIAGIANPDRIVFPTEGGDFSIAANGKITCATAGARVLWWWKASSGVMTQLNVTINEVGAIVSAGLTSAGLTSSGLTRVGLTSSGL